MYSHCPPLQVQKVKVVSKIKTHQDQTYNILTQALQIP